MGNVPENFLHVQEFQAKRKIFPAQLAHVQEKYEEAFNSSYTCQKYGDFAGIFPFLPAIHSTCTFLNVQVAYYFRHISECAKHASGTFACAGSFSVK